jgi:dTDP-4-amino-4,6-dideoxygalactose transaminase
MKIPFNNLGPALAEQRIEIDEAIKRVLDNGVFINGPEVQKLEERFGKEFNGYGVSCANGTDAITLSLLALSKFADHNQNEVITVANSAPATVAAICNAGLRPVFVDITPNGLMDLQKACLLFNQNTLALLPVHLYGQILDLTPIQSMAMEAGIFILEDAAQAYGSQGLKHSPFTKCISFYPTKNLGALGDGGMVVTGAVSLANIIHKLKNYGLNPERCITEANGFNSRLDEMQAAILNVKLERFEINQAARRALAQMYFNLLPTEVLHRDFHYGENYHLFTIRVEHRPQLRTYLSEQGIDTMIHYPVPACDYATMKYQRNEPFPPDLTETRKFCNEVLSLPLWPGMTMEEVVYICNAINDFYTYFNAF